jgi:hypothetical protein
MYDPVEQLFRELEWLAWVTGGAEETRAEHDQFLSAA